MISALRKKRVLVSCSGKFHAFNLSEQLYKHQMLSGLWTTYAFQKNIWARHLTKRIDKEEIPIEKIHTCLPIAFAVKLVYNPFIWNELFDLWVASQLKFHKNDFDVFIGWSGMSLHSIRVAKQMGKITILERGSSHILYQDEILKTEYKKFNIPFSIDQKVINKELKEYEEVDFVSIPSTFVKESFLHYKFPENKLLQTPYGSSSIFTTDKEFKKHEKFTILYLGKLSIRKGLIYLFEALDSLKNEGFDIDAHFIGSAEREILPTVDFFRSQNPEWKFYGHISQIELPNYIGSCNVAVQPSLEEGLSMVIPQILSCGVPVIATTNTGGEDIIEDGKTGYIIPIRSSIEIANRIKFLIQTPDELNKIRENIKAKAFSYSWNRYGSDYTDNILKIINE